MSIFKAHELPVFLHMEKIGGISLDKEGMSYLANVVKPDGIVTTKNSLVNFGKKQGLLTIQRLFLVDSDSIKSGIQSIHETKPDAVEIMPALLPEFIKEYKKELHCPIISGGLISNRDHMIRAIENGALAVSIGNQHLWKEDIKNEIKSMPSV